MLIHKPIAVPSKCRALIGQTRIMCSLSNRRKGLLSPPELNWGGVLHKGTLAIGVLLTTKKDKGRGKELADLNSSYFPTGVLREEAGTRTWE